MKKTTFKGLLALFFVFILPSNIFAEELSWNLVKFENANGYDGEIVTMDYDAIIEMWHYSGGYWGGNIPTKIPDDIAFDNASALASALNNEVIFEINLPNEVKKEMTLGNEIVISCNVPNSNIKLDKLFYYNGDKDNIVFKIDNNILYFKSYPQLNFSEKFIYDDFIENLNKKIPIVDPIYGKNRYAIWTNAGKSLGATDGYFNPENPTEVGEEGTIHPTQIVNSDGKLQDGLKIKVEDDTTKEITWHDSKDVKIGHGTFQNAGAVAMHFWYPLKITFYRVIPTKNDVAVIDISPSNFSANTGAVANVTVINNGKEDTETSLNFQIENVIDKTENVILKSGESKIIPFGFTVPDQNSMNMVAEANKEHVFSESTFDNNKLIKTGNIEKPQIPEETKNCNDTIHWNEHERHVVCYTDSHGDSVCYNCNHTFVYETKLTESHTIDPKTLKSGYGFFINLKNTITTKMIANYGCGNWGNGRNPSAIPVPPTKVELKLPYKVKNKLGLQNFTVYLNKISSSSTTTSFEPYPNLISEIKAKKIYTAIDLAGTEKSPKIHNFDIHVSGGGVNGVEFCKTVTENIKINGNMYTDDITTGN